MTGQQHLITYIGVLVLVGAGVVAAFSLAPSRATGTEARIARLEARIKRQESELQRRSTQIDALLGMRKISREQVRQRSAERQRRRELMSDPLLAIAERQKTLDRYATLFASEQVDRAWAGPTEVFVRDVLDASLEESGTRAENRQIECRRNQCRIDIGLGAGQTPDELLQPLLGNLAETLPNTHIVIAPAADGSGTRVHVFATRGAAKASPLGHG